MVSIMSDHKHIRILCVVAVYIPGYKAGGPIRTVANMVTKLGDTFTFRILTSDRDLGDTNPYPDVQIGEWVQQDQAEVLYLAPHQMSWRSWWDILQHTEYDVLYLNSFFSPLTVKSLLLRRFSKKDFPPVILAPRGEFSTGALQLKKYKKQTYIYVSRIFHLYQGIIWHASSQFEMQDIAKTARKLHLDPNPTIIVAPNLPPALPLLASSKQCRHKQAGHLRLIFLSRLSPKKNLDYALSLLLAVKGHVQFDIYGPIEDAGYWKKCQKLIKALPRNITVSYCGIVPSDQVWDIFSQYHTFLFPTHGENFGHVILESLSAGCPILISNTTPWRMLQSRKSGWDIPLEEPHSFREVLTTLVDMGEETWQLWSSGARKEAESFSNNPELTNANKQVFLRALNREDSNYSQTNAHSNK